MNASTVAKNYGRLAIPDLAGWFCYANPVAWKLRLNHSLPDGYSPDGRKVVDLFLRVSVNRLLSRRRESKDPIVGLREDLPDTCRHG
jgi:hypothetical protein